jgi:hypothetical protein
MNWHAIGKARGMFKTINYKTLTIAAGILVAVLVLVALLIEQNAGSMSALDSIGFPKVSLPETQKMIQETLQKVSL